MCSHLHNSFLHFIWLTYFYFYLLLKQVSKIICSLPFLSTLLALHSSPLSRWVVVLTFKACKLFVLHFFSIFKRRKVDEETGGWVYFKRQCLFSADEKLILFQTKWIFHPEKSTHCFRLMIESRIVITPWLFYKKSFLSPGHGT